MLEKMLRFCSWQRHGLSLSLFDVGARKGVLGVVKRSVFVGLLLVLVGIYILLAQLARLPDGMALVFIGAGLLAARGMRRRGFVLTLIGCLAVSLGLSDVIDSTRFLALVRAEFLVDAVPLFLLSIAFFALHIVEYRSIGNWPLVPGTVLLLTGGAVLLAGNPVWLHRVWQLWPIALVCVGAAMLTKAFRRRGTAKE